MINIAICDDDKYFILKEKEIVEKFLLSMKYEYIINEFSSSVKFVKSLKNNNEIFDIVLLDIDLPEVSGMDIAKILYDEYREKTIINFVTSYDNYVFTAFKYQPLRYIRKQMLEQELPEALSAALRMLESCEKNVYYVCKTLERENIPLLYREIVYIEKERQFINFVINTGEIYQTRGKTMKELMKVFEQHKFSLVHSGVAVNLSYVTSYSDDRVTINNEIEFFVSRRRRKNGFIAELLEYWGNRE